MSAAPVGPPLEALDRALGVSFRDPALREAALTHRSFAFEHGLTVTNERLEFLGDSVLGLVVTDMAYRAYPELPEGQLAKLRAAIVNMTALADVSRALGVGDVVLLGKGEEQSGGRDKASILADALEAIFGAVYLDLGLDVARELIERLFRPRMEAYVRGEGDRDYKTILQEIASQELHALPGVRDRGARARSREGVHGDRRHRRRIPRDRHRPIEEGSRAAGGPAKRTRGSPSGERRATAGERGRGHGASRGRGDAPGP